MRVRSERTLCSSLRRLGSRCTTTTKAAPLSAGSASNKVCSTCTPPAEAPTQTMTGREPERSASPSAPAAFAIPPCSQAKAYSAASAIDNERRAVPRCHRTTSERSHPLSAELGSPLDPTGMLADLQDQRVMVREMGRPHIKIGCEEVPGGARISPGSFLPGDAPALQGDIGFALRQMAFGQRDLFEEKLAEKV